MRENKRLAIVTGGVGGIGTAICERLAKQGVRVVATYHPAEEDKLVEWNKARAEAGVDVALAVCDVSSAEDSARMVAEVEKEFGPVDIMSTVPASPGTRP